MSKSAELVKLGRVSTGCVFAEVVLTCISDVFLACVSGIALVVGLALAGEASTSFLCRVYILQLLSVTGWAIGVRPCLS